LKELWVGETQQAEDKTVYQYVLDLQDRTESTCRLAQEEMEKVQGRNKEYFNKTFIIYLFTSLSRLSSSAYINLKISRP